MADYRFRVCKGDKVVALTTTAREAIEEARRIGGRYEALPLAAKHNPPDPPYSQKAGEGVFSTVWAKPDRSAVEVVTESRSLGRGEPTLDVSKMILTLARSAFKNDPEAVAMLPALEPLRYTTSDGEGELVFWSPHYDILGARRSAWPAGAKLKPESVGRIAGALQTIYSMSPAQVADARARLQIEDYATFDKAVSVLQALLGVLEQLNAQEKVIYRLDLRSDNLATDDKGNLILLDPLFARMSVKRALAWWKQLGWPTNKTKNPPPPPAFGPPDPRIFYTQGDLPFDNLEHLAEEMYDLLSAETRQQITQKRWLKNAEGLWAKVSEDLAWSLEAHQGTAKRPYAIRTIPNTEAAAVAEAFARTLINQVGGVEIPDTPEFKRWFGNSKVVDRAGRPLAVYHGTMRGGFTKFDRGEIDAHHHGFFFTDSPSMAASYSHDSQSDALPTPSPVKFDTLADFERWRNDPANAAIANRFWLFEQAFDYEDEDGNPTGKVLRIWQLEFDNMIIYGDAPDKRSFVRVPSLLRAIEAAINREQSLRQGLYTVFLSFQNPLIIDARGKQWNDIPSKAVQDALTPAQAASAIGRSPQSYYTTDGVSIIARDLGYDSVIIRDLVDYGGWAGSDAPADVFIAFSPTQIKSANHNKGTFDPHDADIRNPAPRVGKLIGGDLYVHKSALHTLPAEVQAQVRAAAVPFAWAIVKYNAKAGTISLIESVDWDTADEPTVGRVYSVTTGKVIQPLADPWIYHHKWQFVEPTYKGFDVAASKARSAAWTALPNVDKSRIGKKSYWEREVLPRLNPGDDLWYVPPQAYDSSLTSVRQVPSTFSTKRIEWRAGTRNADIGGGRYNDATERLAALGVENVVYDPFNRTLEHNQAAVQKIAGHQADTVTVNNVLNVIAEPANRDLVIRQAADALKHGGTAYFLIYKADGTGVGRITKDQHGHKSWQNNQPWSFYVPEVAKHFAQVERKGDLIIARGDGKQENPLLAKPMVDPSKHHLHRAGDRHTKTLSAWAGLTQDLYEGVHVSPSPAAAAAYALGRLKVSGDDYEVTDAPVLIGISADCAKSDLGDVDMLTCAQNIVQAAEAYPDLDIENDDLQDLFSDYIAGEGFDNYLGLVQSLGDWANRPSADDFADAVLKLQEFCTRKRSDKAVRDKAIELAKAIVPQVRWGGDVADDCVVAVVVLPPYKPMEDIARQNEPFPYDTSAEEEFSSVALDRAYLDSFIRNGWKVLWGDPKKAKFWHGTSASLAAKALPSIVNKYAANELSFDPTPYREEFEDEDLEENPASPTHIPPANVAAAARKGLEMRAAQTPSNRCCTSVGLRRAGQLAARQPVSEDTLRRMLSYFQRHEVDKQGKNWSKASKGKQAWLCWGGDPGYAWARRVLGV